MRRRLVPLFHEPSFPLPTCRDDGDAAGFPRLDGHDAGGRQTLADAAVVNITQAHDYTVGMTPQDERGPGFARGFPVDFYDLRRDGLRTRSWSASRWRSR